MSSSNFFAREFRSLRSGVRDVKRIWCAAMAVVAASVAGSSAATAQLAPPAQTATRLPAVIGTVKRGEVKNFEPTNPGLGEAAQYETPGWTRTVYIYDLKRTDLPETAVAAQILPQLQQAVGDVRSASKYSKVDEALSFTVPEGAAAKFHCRSFVVTSAPDANGGVAREFDSYVCVTTFAKRFVKVRLTVVRSPTAARDAIAFVAALDQVLKR